jgi:hypothetical protein
MVVFVSFIGSPPVSGIDGRNPPPDWKKLRPYYGDPRFVELCQKIGFQFRNAEPLFNLRRDGASAPWSLTVVFNQPRSDNASHFESGDFLNPQF